METLFLITSPPRSPAMERVLALAAAMQARDSAVGILLLQDAVLAAIHETATPGGVEMLAGREVPVYVAEMDLAMRGCAAAPLAAGVEAVGDHRLVELMLADNVRVLGAF